jgi:cobalt-zinc-cadmium efflux system protein
VTTDHDHAVDDKIDETHEHQHQHQHQQPHEQGHEHARAAGHSAGHSHNHSLGSEPPTDKRRQALWIAVVANGLFLIVEFGGGVVFHSLTLVADAVHQLSDVAALSIALAALRMMARPATTRNTYGWRRSEVLAALANSVALMAISVWIVVEAVRRFGAPEHTSGVAMIVLGSIGLVVNSASAWFLYRSGPADMNVRGAFLHMAADALGSLGAIVAGLVIALTGARWSDPAAAIVIAVLILGATLTLLRDATRVLLEAAPAGIDTEAVTAALAAEPGVGSVHHLHVWSIGSEDTALSAHVVLTDAPTLHDAQVQGDRLKALLIDRFAIDHATLELECHACEDDQHV